MIVGERILEVSGNKVPKSSIKGLNINISLEDVKMAEENVEITYVYTANYQEEVGQIKIKGVLLAKEEAKLAKDITDTWKKSKKVPDEYATVVLSAVNYSGSANGTLLARVLGLTAPLIPPKIQLSKQADGGAAPAKPPAKK
ncbi:hypothetical protein L0Y65_06485 [Candidatus Micrarchaeota archaeon]|nr:hypothetical protein [Candidatus Micrarchaeota archaeon]